MWALVRLQWVFLETGTNVMVEHRLVDDYHGDLRWKPWFDTTIAPDTFCELCGFRTLNSSRIPHTAMLDYAERFLPIWRELARPHPILTQLGRRHAIALLHGGARFGHPIIPLMGSLAGGDCIKDYSAATGGSDDEQVLKIGAIQ